VGDDLDGAGQRIGLAEARATGIAGRHLVGCGRRSTRRAALEGAGLGHLGGGRPFIWLDDEIRAADRDWVATHHPAPALLHRVDVEGGILDPLQQRCQALAGRKRRGVS
jgi:hypothetical protein